jgi:hypothetical protein
MEEAILNGIPTTFTIIIRLYKTRTLWFDGSISSLARFGLTALSLP